MIFFMGIKAVKCNLTKLTTKSCADWQHGYLLGAVVVSGAWPGHMLTWFFSHTAALV